MVLHSQKRGFVSVVDPRLRGGPTLACRAALLPQLDRHLKRDPCQHTSEETSAGATQSRPAVRATKCARTRGDTGAHATIPKMRH
jgi:hypothetical protein